MKMERSDIVGGKYGWLFSLELLLLAVSATLPLANGQPVVGVSLKVQGTVVPNNSLVDADDILFTENDDENPTNERPGQHDQSLLCVTDLEDCCETPMLGNWYFPNGNPVTNSGDPSYRSNRGQNEVRNDRQFYGSVRLFRRRVPPINNEGPYSCVLPDRFNVSQTLNAYIVNFAYTHRDVHVTFSPPGSGTAGETYSLTCSALLVIPGILPTGAPPPTFQWFFGPNGNGTLPSGMITPTTTSIMATNPTRITYTGTLRFSPLSQSHAGNYTCRIGAGRLVNSDVVTTVIAPTISVQITTSGTPVVGQSGYSLTCGVNGAQNLNHSIIYQWTKNAVTQTQVGTDRVLSFSPLRLSDAGRYACQATVSSPYLNSNITAMGTQDVRLQIPAPTSVMLSSNIPNPIPPFGSNVTLTCAVVLSPAVDVPVTVNTALINSDAGFSNTRTAEPAMGSSTNNYVSTFMISSFGRSDSGLYSCGAAVSSTSNNAYITDSNTVPDSVRVTTGVYLALRGVHIANNSNINIRNIGQTSDNPNGALQCITDNRRCCSQTNPRLGEWYLPNGTLVQGTASTTAFYRNRGANGDVSLNRPNRVESPFGPFCCEVPDATNTNQILCVNIGGVSISIPSDPPIAGESYTLECSAGGSQAGSFQWLGPPDGGIVAENSPRLTISPDSTSSQLQFRPIQQSDSGSYSCSATANGLSLTSEPVMISVDAPTVSVQVSDSGATPTAGENYRLMCSVSGAEKLNPTITYRWTKNSGMQVEMNTTNLSFTPLRLSDAASYACEATITSSYLTGDIVAMSVGPQDIRIQIPPSSPPVLESNNINPDAVIFESAITLTCTLRLSMAIVPSDVSLLLVNTRLFRDGTPLTLTGSTVTGTTFTYTVQLNSFSITDVGNYTCSATIEPQQNATNLNGSSTLPSNNVVVTTGVYLAFNGRLPSNSEVTVTDIGDRIEGGVGGALLCYTDNIHCCNETAENTGRWFQAGPGGGDVGDVGDLYVTKGPNVVRLHRRNNTSPSAGMYCCEVPDVQSRSIRTCVNIVLQPTTSTEPPGPSESSPQQDIVPAVAGGVVAGLAVLILVAIIIIVAVFLRRRSSSKPYEVSKTKSSVLYSKQKNGDQVFGVGINNEPKIVDFPSDTNITEGEGVYFRIKVSGEPQPTVTWYHDGEPVRADYAREIESDGSLAIPSAELKHSGVYKAVAENKHGSEQRELKLTVSEEGAETTVDIGERVKSRPIPIPEFGKYVSELHSNSNKPFKDLYESLDTGEQGHSTRYATDPHRKPLNRFGNIIVYDDNRIVLQPLAESKDCQGDYINACYMDGYSIPNKFIATQGPIPKTVVDFWRLIWQEHPPTIIMVTNVKEGSKIKCQQYWPNSGQESYGPFNVVMTDQQVYADYTVRTLSVSLGSGGRSHKVTQYHFTAWPDHGVPDYATPILAFHRRVKAQHQPSRGPMVVHCSAGVGRTGTFIVIDNILEQIEKEQVVDIPGAITKIRQKRMKMVQTHDQFTFIHDAILESVTCGDTQISATNLRSTIMKLGKKAGFQHQMKVLEQVSPNPDEVQCNAARNHPDKNRGDKYLPADRWRVILKGEQPDYIHAVSINGYKHQRAFIIAQGPLQSTVRNFWKMIYDRKSAVIVMVSDLMEGGQEACAQYWPNSGIAEYGQYTVDLLGEEPLQGFTIRSLSVMDKKTQKAHQVTQFHITCWRPDGHCSNLKSVTDVIEEMTKVQIRSGNKPIVVHCSDTVTRSGMFCAVATTIERCKTEGVVDVFQVVKALRVQKPGAVPTVEQYQQLFETVLVFLESFDTYANFQM